MILSQKVLFGTLAVMGLIMLCTCSLLPGNIEDGVIALKIGAPAGSRGLEVEYYDVQSLDILVYGPDGLLLEGGAITWDSGEAETHFIQAVGPGTYHIEVTHNGVNGDAGLSVTEEKDFEVAVMTITTVTVVPGLLSVIDVVPGEEEPIDLTGQWTVTWELVGGTVVEPLYVSMVQTGDVVGMSFGPSATLIGGTLVMEGAFAESLSCYMDYTGTVGTGGDTITGPFALLDAPDGDPIVHPEAPEWGELQGTMTCVRVVPEMLGSFTLNGIFDWEQWDHDAGILEASGSTDLYFSTSEAMAFFGVSDEGEGPDEWLDIGYMDPDIDIALWFGFAPGLAVGDYAFSADPPIEPWAQLDMRYISDTVELDEVVIVTEGTLHITAWDGAQVAGYFIAEGDTEPMIEFDVPISPESVF